MRHLMLYLTHKTLFFRENKSENGKYGADAKLPTTIHRGSTVVRPLEANDQAPDINVQCPLSDSLIN